MRPLQTWKLYFLLGLAFSAGLFISCDRETRVAKQDEPSIQSGIDSLLNRALDLAGKDIQLARIYLQKGKELLKAHEQRSGLAKYHTAHGRICYYEDLNLESIAHFDSALLIYKRYPNPSEAGQVHYYKASSLALIGNSARAIESAHMAIDEFQRTNQNLRLANVYNFLGSIYIEQNDHQPALDFLNQAKDLLGPDSLNLTYGNTLVSIGKVFLARDNLEQAEDYFQRAYAIRLICADIRHIASSLLTLSQLRINQQRDAEAIPYLREAQEIYQTLEEQTGLFLVYHTFALVLCAEKNYPDAYAYGLQAHVMADSLKNRRHQAKACLVLQQITEKMNRDKESLRFLKQYNTFNQELVSLDKNRLITQIENRIEITKQHRENELLRQDAKIRKQQTRFLTLIALFLILLVVVLIYLSRVRRQNYLHKQKLLENEMKMAEAASLLHENEKVILANDLELKNKELAGKTLELLNQIETLQALAERVNILEDSNSKKEIETLLKELKMKTRETVWDEFHTAFNNVHKEFYDKLFAVCPDLSSTEIKIAALLKLNLSSKEIAAISNKTESAITTARHRLRQKLNLEAGDNLISFLMRI